MSLPRLINEFDALHYYHGDLSDAHKAYVIAFLSKRFTNREISEQLKLKNPYKLSYLKRAGLSLKDKEIALWHKNKDKVTLGHIRALLRLDSSVREQHLREMLYKKFSVRDIELMSSKPQSESSADTLNFERSMSEKLGCDVKIDFNKATQSGVLSLSFFSLDDLSDKAKKLGFKPEDY